MASTRRLAAILAADVAGYSRLMGADEEGTHERLKAHLAELVAPKIGEHSGRTPRSLNAWAACRGSGRAPPARCKGHSARRALTGAPRCSGRCGSLRCAPKPSPTCRRRPSRPLRQSPGLPLRRGCRRSPISAAIRSSNISPTGSPQAVRLSPHDHNLGISYTRIGVAPLLQSRTDEAIIWFEKPRNRTPALPQIRARFAAAWPSAKPLTSPAFGWPGCRRNDLYSRGHAHQDISSMSSILTPRPACRLFLAFPIRCRNRESLSRR